MNRLSVKHLLILEHAAPDHQNRINPTFRKKTSLQHWRLFTARHRSFSCSQASKGQLTRTLSFSVVWFFCQSIGCECFVVLFELFEGNLLSLCDRQHSFLNLESCWSDSLGLLMWVWACHLQMMTVIMMPACRSRDNCWNCSTIPQPHNVCLNPTQRQNVVPQEKFHGKVKTANT